ncbi:MAG TPA: hypothetical protein VFZ68_11065 [Acidimicrobiales bacterium]
MIIVLIGIAVGAAYLASGTGLFGAAVVNAVASVWANGVMANFRADPQAAPNWAAMISMLTTLAALVLGGIALAIR